MNLKKLLSLAVNDRLGCMVPTSEAITKKFELERGDREENSALDRLREMIGGELLAVLEREEAMPLLLLPNTGSNDYEKAVHFALDWGGALLSNANQVRLPNNLEVAHTYNRYGKKGPPTPGYEATKEQILAALQDPRHVYAERPRR